MNSKIEDLRTKLNNKKESLGDTVVSDLQPKSSSTSVRNIPPMSIVQMVKRTTGDTEKDEDNTVGL